MAPELFKHEISKFEMCLCAARIWQRCVHACARNLFSAWTDDCHSNRNDFPRFANDAEGNVRAFVSSWCFGGIDDVKHTNDAEFSANIRECVITQQQPVAFGHVFREGARLSLTSQLALAFCFWLGGGQYAPEAIGKLLHRPFWFICAHVWHVVRVFVAGSFFQHVCGNSEPVSAL